MKLLILGVGSPFGEDTLGWQAIDGLVQRGLEGMLAPNDVRLEKADRPGTLLLERMRGFDCVILIDALADENGQGVRYLKPSDIAYNHVLLSGHGLGVAEALELGRVLGDLPDELHILGIAPGGAVDQESGQPANGLAPVLLDEIVACISKLMSSRCVPQPVPD